MQSVIVTGGAGYVGAHCCLALAAAGYLPVTYDNLSNGHAAFVKWGPLERGDIRDSERLTSVMAAYRPCAVVHCAALIEVGESVTDPARFYDNNVNGALCVLDAMRANGVGAFVFSSTCATYGAPRYLPLDERHPQAPINPYGRTKLMIEQASCDYAAAYGMAFAHLRYFNAAGAAAEANLGEAHEPETHAIPLALMALLGQRDAFQVFGCDYDTRDGSCVRDYVHVLDLADAHVRAVNALRGGPSFALNLGTGDGVTVLELLDAIEHVTGRRVPVKYAPRRPGDAPALVAENAEARRVLGWSPIRGIDSIIASAWEWHAAVREQRLTG
jgi:UDP-glucose 4-epimerase